MSLHKGGLHPLKSYCCTARASQDSPMHHKTVQCITRQSNASQDSPMHHKTVQCITRQSNASQDSPMHHKAVQCITRQSNASQDSPMHHKTVQCITRQSNASQGSPMHHKTVQCITRQSNASQDSPMHHKTEEGKTLPWESSFLFVSHVCVCEIQFTFAHILTVLPLRDETKTTVTVNCSRFASDIHDQTI